MKKQIITQDEVNECIKLLHKDYREAKILVFNAFFEYLKWSLSYKTFDPRQIKKVYKGITVGSYNVDLKHVHVYVFNHKSEEKYLKTNIIHTLFHELRHYYQYNFKEYKWKRGRNVTYELGDYRYMSAPIERDANKFAARMMTRYKEKISSILNVYPDWWVNGYE